MPHSAEATANQATPTMNTRLRPRWSPSEPPTRISEASASREALTTHCSWGTVAPSSSPMLRSAMFTTVPSSIAIPEPSTAAVSTHRPCGVPRTMSAWGIPLALRRHDQPCVTHLRRVRRPRCGPPILRCAPAEVLVEATGPVVLHQAPQLGNRAPPTVHRIQGGLDRPRGQTAAPDVRAYGEVAQLSSVVRREQVDASVVGVADEHAD